jgi:hypothetical protein
MRGKSQFSQVRDARFLAGLPNTPGSAGGKKSYAATTKIQQNRPLAGSWGRLPAQVALF